MPEKKNGPSVERANQRFTVQPLAGFMTVIGRRLTSLKRYDA